MVDWGRKFKSGLAMMVFTLLLFLGKLITEDAFVTMELAFAGMLFGTSVAGKFSNRSR